MVLYLPSKNLFNVVSFPLEKTLMLPLNTLGAKTVVSVVVVVSFLQEPSKLSIVKKTAITKKLFFLIQILYFEQIQDLLKSTGQRKEFLVRFQSGI